MGILESLVNIIAPHDCLVCGQEGALLCDWCIVGACPVITPRCYKCLSAAGSHGVCNNCRRTSRLKHVWVRTDYTGAAKQLVHVMKFARAQAACQTIAHLLNEALPYLDNYVITYVPTASTRLRVRGYDHAQLIAQSLGRTRGLQCRALLARLGQSRQVGAKRSVRLQQLHDNFWVTTPAQVKNQRILLIDDVITTGATLDAAARMLKAAGAKSVSAAVFAQKI